MLSSPSLHFADPFVIALNASTRPHNRFKNLHVPRAATEIPRKAFANICFSRLRILFQKAHGRDHHSRCADTALRPAAFNESLLHLMQLIVAERDAFDRFDLATGDLRDWNQTTVDELTINQNAARAALTFAATFFSSGKAQLLAQHIEQALHWIGINGSRLVIHHTSYSEFVFHQQVSLTTLQLDFEGAIGIAANDQVLCFSSQARSISRSRPWKDWLFMTAGKRNQLVVVVKGLYQPIETSLWFAE